MSREFEEGQLDGMLGREFKTRYRLEEKKREYRKGYQSGLKIKEENDTKDEIRNMNDEERKKCRSNIQRIKDLLN